MSNQHFIGVCSLLLDAKYDNRVVPRYFFTILYKERLVSIDDKRPELLYFLSKDRT